MQSKSVKRTWLFSMLSVVLCFAMLIGTTFAWFTDSATTGVNTIQSGTLDMEVSYKNKTNQNWTEVSPSEKMFDDSALWEPGYTEVVYLKIRNNGDLAFKYQLAVDASNEIYGTNAAGKDFYLSDYIKFGKVVSDTEIAAYNTREEAVSAAEDVTTIQSYSKSAVLLPNETVYVALIVYMPTDVGNEANHNGIKKPSFDLGVRIVANQTPYEKDSFDNTYDYKTAKVLVLGNSYGSDAIRYLWDIYTNAGYEDVVVANLQISGGTIDNHLNSVQKNSANYIYYEYNRNPIITRENNVTALSKLTKENWDIIILQQASQLSGKPETYSNLNKVIDFVNANKTNKNAKIYWNMTWAYQSTYTNKNFANYNYDQMTMYNAISSTVQSEILKNDAIAGIIPCGTTIQNLRTSALGDTLTRDGTHLSYDIGGYAASLTLYATFTQNSISDINTYGGNQAVRNNMDLIKEAVNTAIDTPFAITPIN